MPVIFDTDLGTDIDDVWALVMLLKDPGFDIKLVTTSWGSSEARARSIARILELAGRTDIPIALGQGGDEGEHLMRPWIEDYSLDAWPGTVHKNGVQAIVDTVKNSEQAITYVSVGPLNTLASVLRHEPTIASEMYYVAMLGTIRSGNEGDPGDWNARADVAATRMVLAADWRSVTLAPTDVTRTVVLQGSRYARIRNSEDPLIQAVLENYDLWRTARGWPDAIDRSSTLHDSVAVYLASPGPAELLKLKKVRLAVTNRGLTREQPLESGRGNIAVAALAWKDLEAFRDLLVQTVTSD